MQLASTSLAMALHGHVSQGSSLHATQGGKQQTSKYESKRGQEHIFNHAETGRQGKAAYRMVTIIKAGSTGLSLQLLGLLLVKQGLQP